MQSMLKQAQKMQEDMAQLQQELEEREYEVHAGGGAVSVKINGKKEITELSIDESIVDPDDIETLQDILTAAFNESIKKVESDANDEMSKITGAMGGLSGMGGLGGLF